MLKTQIVGMPEVLGTFLNNADAKALKADAVRYIKDNVDIDLSGNEVNIVENSDSTVHIALPYYAVVGSAASSLSETDLDASGGSAITSILGIASNALHAAADASGDTSILATATRVDAQHKTSQAMDTVSTIAGASAGMIGSATIGVAGGVVTSAVGSASK